MSLPEKKVKKLIGMMNALTQTKMPPMKPILEIFDMAMDEKTLDFLIGIGVGERSSDELKEIYISMFGQEDFDKNWDAFWKDILEMSFVIPGEKDSDKFFLAPIFPGWIELSVSGELNEKRVAIIEKFMEFWNLLKKINIAPIRMFMDAQALKEKDSSSPRMTTLTSTGVKEIAVNEPPTSTGIKEIAVNEPLTSEHQVRTAGDVYSLLERHKDSLSIMNCICRTHKQLNGGACEFDLPIEGCINIGPLSHQLVDSGISRKITFEEACDLIDEFEKKGCIHTLFHYGNDTDKEAINICNCCNDCCLLYSSYQQGYISKVFVKSFYSPQMIDESRCTGCNKCGKYCATGATYYDKEAKKLVFDYDACVGCGQCVTQCKFDVRKMVPDERSVFAKTRKKRQVRDA